MASFSADQPGPNRDDRTAPDKVGGASGRPFPHAATRPGVKQQVKSPPIQPAWMLAAGIATVILLMLTVWRMLSPPQPIRPAPPVASHQREVSEEQIVARKAAAAPAADEALASNHGKEPSENLAETESPSIAPETTVKPATPAAPSAAPRTVAAPRPQNETPSKEAPQSPSKPLVAEQLSAKASQDAPEPVAESRLASRGGVEAQTAKEQADAIKVDAEIGADAMRRWLASAKEFASSHEGRVIESLPFSGGTLRIPTPFNAEVADMPLWFLSGGWLETESGMYAFGANYQHTPPVMRQEIPQLADKLGLASVGLELRPRGNDLVIQATATPKSVGPKAGADRQTELATLKNRLDRLNYQLSEWRRLEASRDTAENRERKTAIRQSLLELLEVPRPAATQEVTGTAATKEEAATARDQNLDSADALIREEIAKLEVRVRELQNDSKSTMAQQRDANDLAVARFKGSCRKISVVIYQAVAPATEAAATAVKPPVSLPSAAPPPPTREVLPASPADLKPTPAVMQWAVDYRESVAEDAFAPTYTAMARLSVQAVSASASQLPKWFQDAFNVNCTICEYPAEGAPRSHELMNAAKLRMHEINAGTSQIAVRFWFSHKNAPAGQGIRPAAETSWHVLTSIQGGAEYRLRAPLTQEMLGALQTKPAKPGNEKRTP